MFKEDLNQNEKETMEEHLVKIEGLLVQARNSLEALRQPTNQQENAAQPSEPATVPHNPPTCTPGTGAINRHRALFQRPSQSRPHFQQPLRSRSRSGSREHQAASAPRQRQTHRRFFVRNVVCLADKDTARVPSIEEKIALKKCGLGERTVSFPKDGTDVEVRDALFEAFPKLRGCGGFEMMRTSTGSRTNLNVICEGACSSEEMKSWCSNRLYIRPIQTDFDLDPVNTDEAACENCLKCGMSIPMHLLRSHVEECSQVDESCGVVSLSSDENDQLELPAISLEPSDGVAVSDEVDVANSISIVEIGDETETLNESNSSDARRELIIEQHNPPRVGEVLTKIKRSLDQNATAVECLAAFCKEFMHGRRLDSRALGEEEPDDTEGETYNIYVSREQVLDDVASELTSPSFKSSVPLCVEFFGEDAEDFGGPRKELLHIAVMELIDRVLEKKEQGYSLASNPAHMTRMYKAAGVIVGLCLLQGGPDMKMFSKEFVDEVIRADDLSTPVGQFAAGLSVTGIFKLVKAYPQCLELMRYKPPKPMTMGDMLSMFRKDFSERGSNSRLREEATMSTFVQYLRDVSGGGRVVTIADIVKFVTCLTSPPPTGFQPVPVIIFQPSSSFLPRAQTCTNALILPIARLGEDPPNKEYIFRRFDLGFKNEYFGVG